MGQAVSISGIASAPSRRDRNPATHRTRKNKPTAQISAMQIEPNHDRPNHATNVDVSDLESHVSDLPDDCLAIVFQSLGSADRKNCSLVCRSWLIVEGQSRQRLSLKARADLLTSIDPLFDRFDSVSKLALKCDRGCSSIGDDALNLISLRCRNLTRLKLRSCRDLTDSGMGAFALNCKSLKKLSCASCTFGAKGMNVVLQHCSLLEELTIKRLRGLNEVSAPDLIGPGSASSSLKTICLKELYNGQCFGPLIAGSKNLKTLKLFRCSGDWDKLLEVIADRVSGLVEIHLERLQVSDRGLAAISNCLNLEILHLVKTPECTNAGIVSVADRCKFLRKLHIDGWKTNRIGDDGLVAIAKCCANLQELVLIGVNPTSVSLGLLASNCRNLERLALCGSETIGDVEILCIAAKCVALKKLCIKGCPVSDTGLEALAGGCPNLVKVKIKKCRGVTSDWADRLRMMRVSLAVNLDVGTIEQQDASIVGAQEIGGEQFPSMVDRVSTVDVPSSSNGRSAMSKARLSLLAGRNFVTSTLRRWSHSNNNDPHNT